LDVVWYEIPSIPGNRGFNDIAYILWDGEKKSQIEQLRDGYMKTIEKSKVSNKLIGK